MASASIPAWIYKFFIPKTQKLAFETTFKNGIDDATAEQFRQITNVRDEVKGLLDSESMQAAIAAIDRYLPSLFGLVNAAEVLPPEFSKYLRVIWTLPVSLKWASNPLVNPHFRFEVIAVLITYAILHRNLAHMQLVSSSADSLSDFEEKSKKIANNLQKAAGIFEYISQVELSKWTAKPDVIIPEALDQTYLALAHLCLAEAGEITIKKGMLKSMAPGTLAKLCMDVTQKYEHVYSLMKATPDTLPPFLNFLNININLWKAIALRLIAEEAYGKGSYGLAVQYIRQSSALMEDKKDATLEQFLSLYNDQRKQIKQLEEKFTNENDTIYYENIPSDPIQYPEAKSIVKTQPFSPPQAANITIGQKKGAECNIQ